MGSEVFKPEVYKRPTWFEETVGQIAKPLPIYLVPNVDLKGYAARGWGAVGCLIEPGYDPKSITFMELGYVMRACLIMRDTLSELLVNANLSKEASQLVYAALRATKYEPRIGDVVPDWVGNA